MSKTADKLTQAELISFKKMARIREEEEKSKLKTRFQRAQKLAKGLAKLLYDEYEAKEVLLFGSATNVEAFNKWSDVDLAAIGIPDLRFYAAVAAVTGVSSDIKVDLVDPEECKPKLREIIYKEGVRL